MPVAALLAVVFAGVFVIALVALALAWAVIQRSSAAEAQGPPLLKTEVLSTISVWADLLSRFAFVDRMRTLLSESGLPWSVGRLTAMQLLAGALGFVVLIETGWMPLWARIGGTLLCALGPYFYVLNRRASRLRAIEEQLPDALDFLGRSLRAGHPFSTSLQMLAAESPQPLAGEIRKLAEERKLGMNWDQAFENLCRRVPIQEIGIFSAAVQLHSRTGGRLNEVLGSISENMREASALRGEVRAISAHGRFTGLLLTSLPFAMVLVLSLVNPDYLMVLLSHPWGDDLIAAAAAGLILAHFVIRRIVTIRI